VLLAAATVAVFWPATGNEFVFDDRVFMRADERTVGGVNREGLVWAFTSTGVSLYMPLARLSLMLDFQLFGKNPFGLHLTSLLLHGAASALVFLVLAALTGALWRSLAVAALCAVHPLRVEPAVWISGRADLLAALFGLLTLLAWDRHLRRRSRAWAALAVGAFLLGMLSKTIIMALPFALLLLDFWPLGRVRILGGLGKPAAEGGDGRAPETATLFGEKAGLFLVAAALVGVSLYILQHGPLVVPAERYPLAARPATSLVSYAFYVEKTLWPTGLTVFYPHRWGEFAWWELAGAASLVLVVSAAAICRARRCPYLAAGWFWFLGTLLPVIGLYQARPYPVADRYAYLPQIGLFVMAVWGMEDIGRGRRRGRETSAVMVLALVLACVPASRAQIRHWKDSESLFRHAVAVTSGNWYAHIVLAKIEMDSGHLAAAEDHCRQALLINPFLASARARLGSVFVRQGRLEAGIEAYQQALRIRNEDTETWVNLGVALAQAGRHVEAAEAYRRALGIDPDLTEGHMNLGNALSDLGRFEEALESYARALRISPGRADIQYNRALVLERMGRVADAIGGYREALRLDPALRPAQEGLSRVEKSVRRQ
jgi:Tfp pilus assembly protein PilF